MLEHLIARNVATLAAVDVELPGGFVVLTGETGAGKSLLVESLRFALGGRARGDLVREGEERAEVSAVFRIPEGHELLRRLDEAELGDPDEPERLVLRRIVRRSGRGTLQVNGAPVALRALDPLRPLLVDLTSQHDHVRLLDPATHRELLDSTPSVAPAAERYRSAFARWREALARREALAGSVRERAERVEELSDLLARAEALGPEEGEEERLEARWTRMVHAEDLQAAAARLYGLLDEADGCAAEVLAAGSAPARELSRLDPDQGEPLAESFFGLQARDDRADWLCHRHKGVPNGLRELVFSVGGDVQEGRQLPGVEDGEEPQATEALHYVVGPGGDLELALVREQRLPPAQGPNLRPILVEVLRHPDEPLREAH